MEINVTSGRWCLLWLLAVTLAVGGPARAQDAGGKGQTAKPDEPKAPEKPDEKKADEQPPEEKKPEEKQPEVEAQAEGKIVRIHFRGNRKVEDEAIRVNLISQVGDPFSGAKLAADVRAIWKMGFFDDVQVDVSESKGGYILVYVVKEKPAIHKILVSGNKDVEVSKINEVLDLKRDSILDVAKIKKNVEKIHDLYIDKGFYLAEVSYELKPYGPNEVDVIFKVDERTKVEIRRINFIGNQAVSDADLRGAMATQEGGWFSFMTSSGTYKEDQFQRDLLLITAHYYDRGYINVKVSRPEVTLSPDKRYMYITIGIEEGPQYSIGKLDFKGDLQGPKSEYFARLHIKTGETFNRSKLSQDMMSLNDHYKDQGYAYVNVTPVTAIDAEKLTVDLTFDIQKGQPVYFERINIRGNSKTRDKVIRREMKVAEGELYSQTLLDLSKRRVQALGFFEKVDLSTKRGSADDRIEVNIEVTERPTGTFQIGAGFSSVENFIAQAQISQNNLFGRGQTLALQAQLSSLRQLFLLRFIEPYFLDTPWTFAFSGFNQSIIYTNFQRNSWGGDLTWGYLLSDYWRVFLTYKGEEVSTSTTGSGVLFSGAQKSLVSSTVIANLFNAGFTSSVRASLAYDSRNDRLFPSKGMFHNLSVEVSDPYLGAQNVFTRVDGFTRFYHPIWGPFVFKLNIQGGWVFARQHCSESELAAGTCSDGVPIFERYFLGGINDVRGFRLRSLGPVVQVPATTDPNAALLPFNIGGNIELFGNSEIEFPIFEKVGIRGVVFMDAGNAYNTEGRYCNKNIVQAAGLSHFNNPCQVFDPLVTRTSWGFGFRWFSPIGPLRFEWGLPFSPQPGEDPIVFEFTIGNFF
jgi:outer membrane protein insertion porin family